jgi:hypothetical protein
MIALQKHDERFLVALMRVRIMYVGRYILMDFCVQPLGHVTRVVLLWILLKAHHSILLVNTSKNFSIFNLQVSCKYQKQKLKPLAKKHLRMRSKAYLARRQSSQIDQDFPLESTMQNVLNETHHLKNVQLRFLATF